MADTLEIHLGGQLNGVDVRPETFPLADLVTVLQHFLRAVRAEAVGNILDLPSPDFMSLSGIEVGSTRLVLQPLGPAIAAVERITAALSRNTMAGLRLSTQQELKTAFNRLIEHGATVALTNGRATRTFSRIAPLPPIVRPKTIQGQTNLLVYVLGAGNHHRPSARVRLHNGVAANGGRDLIVKLSSDLCKQIGQHLFQDVSLRGVATWVVDGESWRVEDFRVDALTPLRGDPEVGGRSLGDVFSELAAASGDAWRGVDPGSYTMELRQEADEVDE